MINNEEPDMGSAMREPYAKGQPIEIRVRRPGGDNWRPATALGCTSRGVSFKFEGEHRELHVLFNDVRQRENLDRPSRPPQRGEPLTKPLLTAADIERINATQAAPVQTLRVVTKLPMPVEAPPSARRSKQRHLHEPTVLSSLLRSERLKRGLGQVALAEIIGMSDGHISRIELGDVPITDEHLIKYSELFGLDLGHLERLRDQKQFAATEQAPAIPLDVLPALERPKPEPAPPVAPESRPVQAALAREMQNLQDKNDVMAFVEFCTRLREVAPIPSRDCLDEWNRLAVQLWGLGRQ